MAFDLPHLQALIKRSLNLNSIDPREYLDKGCLETQCNAGKNLCLNGDGCCYSSSIH